MIIAVTGANGHVGANLCRELLHKGHNVRALSHNHDQALRSLPIEIVKGDMLDLNSLLRLTDGAEVIFHLAARISISGDPDGMVGRINHEGTRNILKAARQCNIKRFIHFSSIHAFRQHPVDKPLDENRPLVEQDGFAYDRSKAAGERCVMEAAKNGLDALVLSPTAIIGPADWEPSLTGKAVIDMCNQNIPALVPGGYDWVDVRDVVDSAISAIEHGRSGEKYLLSGHWHSLREFSEFVGDHFGNRTVRMILPTWAARFGLPFISLYSRLSGTKPLYTSESLTIISEGSRMISCGKAMQELGHRPRPVSETVRDLINWFRENGFIQEKHRQ
jgi:dihydroflavonol-4-reductase